MREVVARTGAFTRRVATCKQREVPGEGEARGGGGRRRRSFPPTHARWECGTRPLGCKIYTRGTREMHVS